MANLQGLSDVTVEVNDEVIQIKANSLEFKSGAGNMNARAQTSGGRVSIVTTEDIETKVGMVKFVLISETGNQGLKEKWLRVSRLAQGNVLRLSGQGLSLVFRGMIIKEEPTTAIGVEGEIEIEFCGEPAA